MRMICIRLPVETPDSSGNYIWREQPDSSDVSIPLSVCPSSPSSTSCRRLSNRLQWSNCNLIRENVSLSQTRVIGASQRLAMCTKHKEPRSGTESANTAERVRIFHYSIALNIERYNASNSETGLANKSPPGLEEFLSVT